MEAGAHYDARKRREVQAQTLVRPENRLEQVGGEGKAKTVFLRKRGMMVTAKSQNRAAGFT